LKYFLFNFAWDDHEADHENDHEADQLLEIASNTFENGVSRDTKMSPRDWLQKTLMMSIYKMKKEEVGPVFTKSSTHRY